VANYSSPQAVSLVFDPGEMAQALKLPLDDILLCTNTFGRDILDPRPFEIAVFPYAQHFVTTSFPTGTSCGRSRILRTRFATSAMI